MRYDRTGARAPPAAVAAAEWDERLTRVLSSRRAGWTSRCTSSPPWAGPARSCSADGSPSAARSSPGAPGAPARLVILRTACRFDGRYEWAHHIGIGEAQGITPAELAAFGGDLSATQCAPLGPAGTGRAGGSRRDGRRRARERRYLVGPRRPARRGRPGGAPHADRGLPHVRDGAAVVAGPARAEGRGAGARPDGGPAA